MQRIDTTTAVTDMPAPLATVDPGYFTRGNPGPGTPVPATNLDPDWCNNIQEELASLAEIGGTALDKTKNNQAAVGIQSGQLNYAVDTGAANAYVVAFSPALAARIVGAPFRVKFINSNTGASTITDGVGGTPSLVALDGTALRNADIPANAIYTIRWDGASYRIAEVLGHRISRGISDASTSGGIAIDSTGDMTLSGGGTTTIASSIAGSGNVLITQGASTAYSTATHNANNNTNTANGANAVLLIGSDSGTSRSINAGGTVNASGSDYADYETKGDECGVLLKGQIVGFDTLGYLTDKWSKAITYGVKSTAPSMVGGDCWATEDILGLSFPIPPQVPKREDDEDDKSFAVRQAGYITAKVTYAAQTAAWDAAVEVERPKVDRIAKAGKVPCIVSGALNVGDYIVAGEGPNDTIIGVASKVPTDLQRTNIVGRVRTANPSVEQITRLIGKNVKREPSWNAIIEVMHG